MGIKLMWTGLTLMLAIPKFWSGFTIEVVGGIFMTIGCILMWLDK